MLQRSDTSSYPLDGQAERAARLTEGLRSGEYTVVSQDDSSLVLETRRSVATQPRDDPQDYTIPYTNDLDPVELIRTITLDEYGMLRSDVTNVVTSSGATVLVSTQDVTFEIVDDAPDGMFK